MTNIDLHQNPSKSNLWREIFIAFGITLIVTLFAEHIAPSVAILDSIGFFIVVLTFIYVPTHFIRRAKRSFSDFGLEPTHWGRRLLEALPWMFGVLSVWWFGFHLVHTKWFDFKSDYRIEKLLQWSDTDASQAAPLAEKGIYLGVSNLSDRFAIRWNQIHSLHGKIECDGVLKATRSRGTLTAISNSAYALHWKGGKQRGVEFQIAQCNKISFSITNPTGDALSKNSAQPIPQIFTGLTSEKATTSSVTLEKSWTWIILLILTQLIAVAYPEEFFYRGFLQSRLSQVFADKKSSAMWAIGITSVLFALGHFLMHLNPMRLLVFFPSLLFGYMRHRTGHIGASVIMHAAANVAVELVSRFYI